MNDAWARPVRRYVRTALYLEFLVEFGFFVALLATAGLFNGGQPTTTPLIAEAYFIVGFIVTLFVIPRTRRLHDAAENGNAHRLWHLHLRAWAWVAFVFSAVLPGIALLAAVARTPPGE
jgi:hypothetical protein